MTRNPFDVLGLSDSVTQNELYERYRELRSEYQDKRFEPGAAGTEACEKLDEIESAYKEADQILKERYYITNYDNLYENIEKLIKDNKLDDAQSELDKIIKRDGNWHFHESMVYYRKGWFNDAEEQLNAALELEPGTQRYIDALAAIRKKMETGGKSDKESAKGFYDAPTGDRTYRDMPPAGGAVGCTPCNCCSALLCTDCCCECMGGDCIPCC